MPLNHQTSDPILLGSGELYAGLYTTSATPTDDQLINLGAIESGCELTISPENVEVNSANRGRIARWKVDTNVKLTTGIMTWVLENVSQFLLGSTYTTSTGEKKVVIGKDDQTPTVFLKFIHKMRDGGELHVVIYKAQFDGELSFMFDKENPVTVNYEFVALTNDENNYVEIIEKEAA